MRVLVISSLYPPVAFGGYEVECAGVVEHLRRRHDVLVLSSDRDRRSAGGEPGVRRELANLTPDTRGAMRAPAASWQAVGVARRALAWRPDVVYAWNCSSVPHALLRVLGDSGVPLAFRVCEHWFGGLFAGDQYMRELLPARRGPLRGAWAAGCRALNALPRLRLRPTAPLHTAVSWNSEAIREMVDTPAFLDVALERVCHSVPRYGELYAQAPRDPAPTPEIAFLGRVTPYKGLSVAIEALALLRAEHGVAAQLVVLGPQDGEHAADMRRLAGSLGVAEAVRWRGQVAPEQAVGALARAHALIVPSVWDEPFPLVTIEGAFARVPLVAANVGGIGEGMHDEQHALLFARGDARAAAAALARTLNEPEQTAARVRRARERAEQFTLPPYLQAQEGFLLDAHAALRDRHGRTRS